MRRSTVLLGLTVTAGALVTAGSGWWAARSPSWHELAFDEAEAAARMRNGPGALDVRRQAESGTHETALPWLHNFAATAESAVATPGVVKRMARWRAPDESCSAAAYGGLMITADVTGGRGREQVLASFTQGVLVLDAGGALVASANAPECQGTADNLEAIAAGDAHIDGPVIALAVTTGGHRASSTWLVLYRVIGGVVEPVFSGAVEERISDQTRTGAVTLLPGALVYRTPAGTQTMWTYSAEQGRYTELPTAAVPGV